MISEQSIFPLFSFFFFFFYFSSSFCHLTVQLIIVMMINHHWYIDMCTLYFYPLKFFFFFFFENMFEEDFFFGFLLAYLSTLCERILHLNISQLQAFKQRILIALRVMLMVQKFVFVFFFAVRLIFEQSRFFYVFKMFRLLMFVCVCVCSMGGKLLVLKLSFMSFDYTYNCRQ